MRGFCPHKVDELIEAILPFIAEVLELSAQAPGRMHRALLQAAVACSSPDQVPSSPRLVPKALAAPIPVAVGGSADRRTPRPPLPAESPATSRSSFLRIGAHCGTSSRFRSLRSSSGARGYPACRRPRGVSG